MERLIGLSPTALKAEHMDVAACMYRPPTTGRHSLTVSAVAWWELQGDALHYQYLLPTTI